MLIPGGLAVISAYCVCGCSLHLGTPQHCADIQTGIKAPLSSFLEGRGPHETVPIPRRAGCCHQWILHQLPAFLVAPESPSETSLLSAELMGYGSPAVAQSKSLQ